MDFKTKYQSYVEIVNEALDQYIKEKDTPESTIYKAMRYSLLAGGKRLRPVLVMAVSDMLVGSFTDVMAYACALEMIHTYSLIHDDLPAMDNDDYRRGRLTNHKVFGEATAILAGDALLTYAFEIMANDIERAVINQDKVLGRTRAMAAIARAAGTSGMIGGQLVDLESEGKMIPETLLEYMHRCKTGALIKASVMVPAILHGIDDLQASHLERFAEKLGLAFQIRDDILDVESTLEAMGKPANSDQSKAKSTYVSIHGLDKSKELLQKTTEEAMEALGVFFGKADFLLALSEYLVHRQS